MGHTHKRTHTQTHTHTHVFPWLHCPFHFSFYVGYQTAFFSDTLLAALEEIYKGYEDDGRNVDVMSKSQFSLSQADQSTNEPSQAVKDMVSLMSSAMQSSALRAMHSDQKLRNDIKNITVPIVREQVAETTQHIHESTSQSAYSKMYTDIKRDLSMNMPEDPDFLHKLTVSVRSEIPPAMEENDFVGKVEAIAIPIVAKKVENKSSELMQHAQEESLDMKLRVARLDEGLAEHRVLLEKLTERQQQLFTSAPMVTQSKPTTDADPQADSKHNGTANTKEDHNQRSAKLSGDIKGAKSPRSFSRSAVSADADEDAASIARLRASRDKAEMRSETISLIDQEAAKLRDEMQNTISALEIKIGEQLALVVSKEDDESNKDVARLDVPTAKFDEMTSQMTQLTSTVDDLSMARELTDEQVGIINDRIDKLKMDTVSVDAMGTMESKFDGGLKSMQECLDVLQGELSEMDDKIQTLSESTVTSVSVPVPAPDPMTTVISKPVVSSINTAAAVAGTAGASSVSPVGPSHAHAPLTSPPAAVAVAEAIVHAKQHDDALLSARSKEENLSLVGAAAGDATVIGEVVDFKDQEAEEDIKIEEETMVNDFAPKIEEPAVAKKVHIFVKTFVDKIVPLVVMEDETILSVKKKVEAKENIVVESQRLIYAGQEMMDFGLVSDYNLVTDSTLHLKLKAPSTFVSNSPVCAEAKSSEADDDKDKEPRAFKVNDIVEGKFGRGSKWFEGTIKKVYDDGTCDIHYNDGDEESMVSSDRIRYPKKGSPRASSRGSNIEGGFSREPSPRKGSAQSSPLAGLRMKASPVLQPLAGASQKQRRSPKNSSPSSPSSSSPFMKAPLSNESGISDVNLEESMDSVSSSGLGELVLPARVKMLQEKRRQEEADKIQLEQAVAKGVEKEEVQEGNEGGEGEEGKVVKKEESSTIDHDHAPNTEPPADVVKAEHQVEEMVQHQGKTHPSKTGEDIPESNTASTNDGNDVHTRTDETFQKGESVLALYAAKLGRTKWFPGEIVSINDDGTYDVEFDDGDSERSVLPEHVKATTDTSLNASALAQLAAAAAVTAPNKEPQKSPRPPAAAGLAIETFDLPINNTDGNIEKDVRKVSTVVDDDYESKNDANEYLGETVVRASNQESSPGTVKPPVVGRQSSIETEGAVQGDNDELSVDDMSFHSDGTGSLHQFDTDSELDEQEASSDTDPVMKGLSAHLRRGTAQQESKQQPRSNEYGQDYKNGEEKQVYGNYDDDISRNLHEPGMDSDFSNASTPTKSPGISSVSPRSADVEKHIGGDALSNVLGAHDVRARTIRQMSPRNATPGSNRNRERFEDTKDGDDERHQEETNKALENMDEDDEDERILEGTGRENIWDRIQLSTGKKSSGSGHILSSPKQTPSSPFSPLVASSSGETPIKQQATDGGKLNIGDSKGDIARDGDGDGDGDGEDGPATSPDRDTTLSPSTVLTEALKSLQVDPEKTAVAAKALADVSSPEPVLTGVLRRRQVPKRNVLPTESKQPDTKTETTALKDEQPSENQPQKSPIKTPTHDRHSDNDDEEYDAAAIREAAKRAISASVSAVKYSEARAAVGGSSPIKDSSGKKAYNEYEASNSSSMSSKSVPPFNGTSQCTFCLKKIQNSEMGSHLKSCTLRYESCKDCGAKMRFIKLNQHMKNECPMRSLDEDDDEEEDDLTVRRPSSDDADTHIDTGR